MVWFGTLAAAAALGGAGVENEALGAVVSAVPFALPEEESESALYRLTNSSNFLQFLNRPGRQPFGGSESFGFSGFFDGMLSRISGWISDALTGRRLQPGTDFPCRPSRRPGEYGIVNSIGPEYILACVKVRTEEIFQVDHQIADMSFGQFGGLEVMLITQRRGPVRYIEVITSGDYAHYDVNRNPLKTFRDHSCLNREQWCFVAQVQPIDAGFLVVDRHRLIHYNYTWLLDGDTAASDVDDVFVSEMGNMNSNPIDATEDSKFSFPTAVAEYKPYNMSLVALHDEALAGVTGTHFEITSLIPHAWCRLLFVTDTGNHRVVILNATYIGQFDYIGQFGITGEARSNSTGFDWPWGIAVHSPAWEGRYEPSYANVFVVDRRNHRLVKLNLGYPLLPCENDADGQVGPLLYNETQQQWMCRRYDKPRLSWSAEYGREASVFQRPEGLTDPTAVAIYKHYIVVAEAAGNAVTLLRVDHQPPYGLHLVTYFKPVQGVSMQGAMVASTFGYIWYTYMEADGKNYFSSMYLPEILRESLPPNRFQDFLTTCVNRSWYQDLIDNPPLYIEHMGFILNASVINWLLPDEPEYLDIQYFNKSGTFDLEELNRIVYNNSMVTCDPPTTPTPPPFFGGNEEGWVIDGQSQSEFTKRSGSQRFAHVGVLFALILFVYL
jgi:hypothetical protein